MTTGTDAVSTTIAAGLPAHSVEYDNRILCTVRTLALKQYACNAYRTNPHRINYTDFIKMFSIFNNNIIYYESKKTASFYFCSHSVKLFLYTKIMYWHTYRLLRYFYKSGGLHRFTISKDIAKSFRGYTFWLTLYIRHCQLCVIRQTAFHHLPQPTIVWRLKHTGWSRWRLQGLILNAKEQTVA